MKKLITSLLLTGSLALAGCGSSNDDIVNQIQNINTNPPVAQGYFVNSATGSDVTGAFATGGRFATIQAALLAAPAGSDIIVEPGNYTGTVNLDNGDRLLGSESTLLMGTATTRPVLTGNVDMADGNTIDFMALQGSNVDAISGDGQNGGTVTNCQISNTVASNGFSGVNFRGTWTVSNNTFTNTGAVAILWQTANADVISFRIENNTVTTSQGAIGVLTSANSVVNASIKGNQLTGNAGGGFAVEVQCLGISTLCLDIENNTNNDNYSFAESTTASELSIEQLGMLTAAQPAGAGNTGAVTIQAGIGFDPLTDAPVNTCGFP